MIKAIRRYAPVLIIILFLLGCSHVISRSTLKSVDKETDFLDIKYTPYANIGSVAVLGGRIVSINNQSDMTLIEVFQLPLSPTLKPLQDTEKSQGRFLILRYGFLDPSIYMNKLVTVAGPVSEPVTRPLDKKPYRYPVIESREFYIWKAGEERRVLALPEIGRSILGN
ncbi:MAG: Slp family lipoprotein [Thermodesulfobacteriota bacterium]